MYRSILSRRAQYHATQQTTYSLRVEETFGQRVRRLRERYDVSVGTLAASVGVTEGAIRQIESGQTKSASFGVGVRLADALGVSPHYLATGKEAREAFNRGEDTEQSNDERKGVSKLPVLSGASALRSQAATWPDALHLLTQRLDAIEAIAVEAREKAEAASQATRRGKRASG